MPFIKLLETTSFEDRSRISGVISSKHGLSDSSEDCSAALTFVDDLDSLPFSGWEALADVDKHDKLDLFAIMTSRGCPFKCKYCASHRTWGRKVRYRSPENVMAEVDYVTRTYGVRYVKIQDDTFTVNKHQAALICEMLGKRRDLRWNCTTRADCIDMELAKVMASNGCSSVSIGVESGVDRILDLMAKGETLDCLRKASHCLKKAKIPFVAFIMIGFPSETEAETQKTLEFAMSLGADSLCGSVVTPYPGTALYEWAEENGRIKVTDYGDWQEYYHQSSERGLWDIPPDKAGPIIEAWFKAIENYNERPSRLIRSFAQKFRSDPAGTINRAFSVLRRKFGR